MSSPKFQINNTTRSRWSCGIAMVNIGGSKGHGILILIRACWCTTADKSLPNEDIHRKTKSWIWWWISLKISCLCKEMDLAQNWPISEAKLNPTKEIQWIWSNIPNNAFKDVRNSEGGLCKGNEQNHVGPCILSKLILVHSLLQSQNKPHKSCNQKNKITA
jgi:hypothetical protein